MKDFKRNFESGYRDMKKIRGKCMGKFITLDINFNFFLHIWWLSAFQPFINKFLVNLSHVSGTVKLMGMESKQNAQSPWPELLIAQRREALSKQLQTCINTHIKFLVLINPFPVEEALLNLILCSNLSMGIVCRLGT